ncbi:MAG: hypothetical protein CVU41_17365 [Chloroflexi bacterium HGW-Chloroflexi-3]|nr:MAG: hypothetical protein CVU41_17365 [Chloroflexi bacterium HGW-Chloroflexi-3]
MFYNKEIFFRIEESKRSGSLPKQHYKFYFFSVIQNKESQILLDILVEKNMYPKLAPVTINSPLFLVEGNDIELDCPTKDCLLGDKLTAFALHTTGIPYGKGKDLEIAKQLFDVATLFDAIEDIRMVKTTFNKIAFQELTYRGLQHLSTFDALWDSFNTSILIGSRGVASSIEYAELVSGFRKMAGFVFSGYFSLDTAILCASKVAYLSALLLKEGDKLERFQKDSNVSSWVIKNQDYNKLNKLKKTDPEAFYYFFQALKFLSLLEN